MKVLYGLLLILLIIIGAAFYYYFVVLPENISNALLGGNEKPIPQKIIEKGESLGLDVEKDPGKIVRKLEDNNINIEEIKELIEKAKQSDLDSAEIAFQFLKDNFDFGDFPIDSFKNEFHQYFDQKRFEKAMDFYEKNKDQMPIIYPVLKESLIKYLEKIQEDDTLFIELKK